MTSRPVGYLALVLHAHLPYVRHAELESSIEEEWLFEAVAESYLPLLSVLDGLARERVAGRITVSLSPPLLAMLDDALLRDRLLVYLDQRAELAARERQRVARDDPRLQPAVDEAAAHFARARSAFEQRDGDVAGAFDAHHRAGRIELITSTATHAFGPLIADQPGMWRAQVQLGVQPFAARFGRQPRGLWLAECGYQPGLERELASACVQFTFLDAHGLLTAEPPPRHAMYAPVWCPGGVAAFGRDPETADRIWSSRTGYPGDGAYREFHRDIGHELPLDQLAPVITRDDLRRPTGLRYWRVTDRASEHREPYDPAAAAQRAREHATDFVRRVRAQLRRLAPVVHDRPPVIVAPFDCELFGHWWWEGPQFLDAVLRELAISDVEAITPVEYLARHPTNPLATPGRSSWGAGGHASVWLNPQTDWIHTELQRMAARLRARLAERPRDALGTRALRQAGRELLLAQASDWPFLIRMGTSAEYAAARVRDHVTAFDALCDLAETAAAGEALLDERERRFPVFPDLDLRLFA